MADIAVAGAPRRESGLLRTLKALALIRESVVGMIGLGLILFWILIAILADLIAPFPPNATIFPLAVPSIASPCAMLAAVLLTENPARAS